ncbi:hypothetical protein KIL84_021263 [Mauremys mutica]|uniref:Uncharacterized protein n=1 Tax=Mauremys mutica TaxID=74926 RepID=A0A9D3X735_9SAUR|nr:hypothetical protein KIL84_021263 [Mauremys mutica]
MELLSIRLGFSQCCNEAMSSQITASWVDICADELCKDAKYRNKPGLQSQNPPPFKCSPHVTAPYKYPRFLLELSGGCTASNLLLKFPSVSVCEKLYLYYLLSFGKVQEESEVK